MNTKCVSFVESMQSSGPWHQVTKAIIDIRINFRLLNLTHKQAWEKINSETRKPSSMLIKRFRADASRDLERHLSDFSKLQKVEQTFLCWICDSLILFLLFLNYAYMFLSVSLFGDWILLFESVSRTSLFASLRMPSGHLSTERRTSFSDSTCTFSLFWSIELLMKSSTVILFCLLVYYSIQ